MGNTWHERFGSDQYIYGEEPNQFIREQFHRLKKGSSIVAFAEGEGRNAVFIARQGHHVTAYDYAENGLSKTEALAKRYEVKLSTELKDLTRDSVPVEEFEAAFMVFGHFSKNDQKNVINKLISTVKPEGIIMFEVYSEDQVKYGTGGPKSVDMLYNPFDVLQWIKDYHVIHFFYGEQERVEGELHRGTGHVIQVIIKK
ncbi:class I SAM-dependent methyltransferase [Mesobacillus stamsii]|uniref:SAM-dependent methyltransferase n=1 Tax=Mesobacillus stamsii TaxID=225347 RepID=A0ABU0FR34_9BACI|nr:class I SAM-dependent methyltransferase [Mesobacillus stamsii]MDQ0411863.1 SAM-dependent methyltransferase [Mesobacillus stamsii]